MFYSLKLLIVLFNTFNFINNCISDEIKLHKILINHSCKTNTFITPLRIYKKDRNRKYLL